MLLDDVMSELDADRRRRLVDLLRAGGQSVITTTDLAHVPTAEDADVARLAIANGAVLQDAQGGVRRAAPRPLSHAIDAAVTDLAPQTPLARVQSVWSEAVGERNAAQGTPVRLAAGRLTVYCEHSGLGRGSAAARARDRAPTERALGDEAVREIRARRAVRAACNHRLSAPRNLRDLQGN